MALYTYDCDMGQGLVEAPNLEAAIRLAKCEAGEFAYRGNVKKATKEDLVWRRAMGGTDK